MKTALSLTIRPVEEGDCRLLWEWANDPLVRAHAFSSAPIPWEEHLEWFKRKQVDPNCTFYILMDSEGRPAGQVRFDRQPDGGAEIDISLASHQRGRGIGTQALMLACESFLESRKGRRVVGFIKPENIASIRIFEKAGFSRQGKRQVEGHEAVSMSLELEKT